jgi:hypothetical protein
VPLAALLHLARALVDVLQVDPTGVIDRIKGGIAFRAPGIVWALLPTRLVVFQWQGTVADLRLVHEFALRTSGLQLDLTDVRDPVADTDSKPAVTARSVQNPDESGTETEPMDEPACTDTELPGSPTEDDDPGFSP